MSPELRIGIIGLGWPGAQHSLAVAQTPEARVVAACDLNAERRAEYRQTFPEVARLLGGYEGLLAVAEVDAVVISLPNFLHFPVTLAALQAGKHVLCEKPPTLNLSEIETIRDEARARGLTYAFGRQFRFDPPMMAAREAVAAGRLGKVYYAKTHWLRQRGIPFGVGGWFTDRARAGGGALIDIGVHALDAAWFLAGHPRPVSASAHVGAHFAGTVPAGVKFDVDDTAVAFLRFENGMCIHLEATWAMNLTDVGNKPNSWSVQESMNTTLHGETATLQIDPPTLFSLDPRDSKTLIQVPLLPAESSPPATAPPAGDDLATRAGATHTSATDGPAAQTPAPVVITNFGRQMADFCRAVRTGTEPTNSVDQAVELMRMLGAIYESGRTGREVRFD